MIDNGRGISFGKRRSMSGLLGCEYLGQYSAIVRPETSRKSSLLRLGQDSV